MYTKLPEKASCTGNGAKNPEAKKPGFDCSSVWVIFDHRHVPYFRYLQIPGPSRHVPEIRHPRIRTVFNLPWVKHTFIFEITKQNT